MRRSLALIAMATTMAGLAACSGTSSAIPSTSAVSSEGGARKSLGDTVSDAVDIQGGARKSLDVTSGNVVDTEGGARKSLGGARKSL